MHFMKIFCIIPAYNEEKTIIEVINKVKPHVNEIVVVDDASVDNTYQIVKELSSLVILKHLTNRGQGAALQTGNDYALMNGADIIVHFDADGQFVAEEIKDIIKPIVENQADIVFGSRFLEKKSQIPWVKLNIIIPLARLANQLFLGVNLTDPQSGFRAMNRRAAKTIKINHDRMAHCSEIIHKAFKNNLRVKEIPITVIYRNFGQRFSGGLKIIKDLMLGKLTN
ncbi:hypothetical protein COV49_02910 [Candidatus Falkowbacteria bacterium CG11_big_fil_rev_8_21_14_0_20_39_10]|uniref:Glycosyltransferase 2-like domain-containing protein n=1 Tax=Candidatus Falkowbacteria bacterium CG11_big_fil_rev_8_21_14_0_20_39_10 TaxID=1974570 RepID=A0A2M6K8V5_9BACT|nr:MAG: hypothetical protein COV49_02910 [Candidatus Falkowbacteria bacterium CG11_big_fil_rev_8_21_14_0_20_39_10]